MQIESTEIDYVNMITQWVLFLGLVTVWVLPALLFYLLARKHKRKAWAYLLIGLVLSFAITTVITLIMLGMRTYVAFNIDPDLLVFVLPAIYILIGSSLMWAAYEFLKVRFERSNKS